MLTRGRSRSPSTSLGLYALYTYLRARSTASTCSSSRVTAVLAGRCRVVMAAAGVSMAWCLLVLALTPWVTVVGYELRGHEHNARVLQSLQ